jgi:ribosomal protein S18 acetylase RimI-like enzyme
MDSGSIQLVPRQAARGPHAVVELDRRFAAAAGDAFAASHADYPAFRALFPAPARRDRALRAFFTATVADAAGAGVVHAVIDRSAVLGAAVWLPPGGFPWSIRRQLAAAPAFARVAVAAPTRFPAFVRCGAAAQRAHPHDRHWYLAALGVRPEAQRGGLGTRLLGPVLARADRDGLACYLETSDHANVAFYQRLGFEVADADLSLVPGGPAHVAMRRPPKPR